ncbi:unnamed protein product [Pylaiella littoralis]
MRASCVLAAGVCGMAATEAFVFNPSVASRACRPSAARRLQQQTDQVASAPNAGGETLDNIVVEMEDDDDDGRRLQQQTDQAAAAPNAGGETLDNTVVDVEDDGDGRRLQQQTDHVAAALIAGRKAREDIISKMEEGDKENFSDEHKALLNKLKFESAGWTLATWPARTDMYKVMPSDTRNWEVDTERLEVWEDEPNPVEELTGSEWFTTFAPSDVEIEAAELGFDWTEEWFTDHEIKICDIDFEGEREGEGEEETKAEDKKEE